jgi:hypothetical protein
MNAPLVSGAAVLKDRRGGLFDEPILNHGPFPFGKSPPDCLSSTHVSGDPQYQYRPGGTDWAKLFSSPEAADRWFSVHDPEGVAWGTRSTKLLEVTPFGSMWTSRKKMPIRTGSGLSLRKWRPKAGLEGSIGGAEFGNIR